MKKERLDKGATREKGSSSTPGKTVFQARPNTVIFRVCQEGKTVQTITRGESLTGRRPEKSKVKRLGKEKPDQKKFRKTSKLLGTRG